MRQPFWCRLHDIQKPAWVRSGLRYSCAMAMTDDDTMDVLTGFAILLALALFAAAWLQGSAPFAKPEPGN
jgi:hypothetical protein